MEWEIWDTKSGNLLLDVDKLDDAMGWVRQNLAAGYPREYVRDWSLGPVTDSDVHALDGDDLLATIKGYPPSEEALVERLVVAEARVRHLQHEVRRLERQLTSGSR